MSLNLLYINVLIIIIIQVDVSYSTVSRYSKIILAVLVNIAWLRTNLKKTPRINDLPLCLFFPVVLVEAMAAPLLLKAKETSELSVKACASLHLGLELLSQQEEVGKHFHHPC